MLQIVSDVTNGFVYIVNLTLREFVLSVMKMEILVTMTTFLSEIMM
jgi:hypothetical protein